MHRPTADPFAAAKSTARQSPPAVSIPLKALVQEAPSQVIAVEEFFSTPGSPRSRTASAQPAGHLNLCQVRFCQAVRLCVLADLFFFVGNNGNSGNSRMNIGRFCSQALGPDWEQVETGLSASRWNRSIVPSVPNCWISVGNARTRTNTACSHCSHCSRLFPTSLCRLRENIKGRVIGLFARAHLFHSGFTLPAEIGEPSELAGCAVEVQARGVK